MQVYRCGNCRKELIVGAEFCTHCESFFNEPVSASAPSMGGVCLITPVATPFMKSRKIMSGLMAGLSVMALACLSAILLPSRVDQVDAMSYSPRPTLSQALNADLVADDNETYTNRRFATDLMLSLSTQCFIRHSTFSRQPGDHVVMISNASLTAKQERSRAIFAAMLLRALREYYYHDDADQSVHIVMLDSRGRLFTAVVQARSQTGAMVCKTTCHA